MTTFSEHDFCLIATAIAVAVENKKSARKAKSKWVKSWLTRRIKYSHINLLGELRLEVDDYRNYLRMDEDTYRELLSLVTPLIKKQNTIMREAISPHERLSVTLRFLATGRSYEDLKFSSIISPQALGRIIPETCEAIFKILSGKYMKFPSTQLEWKGIATTFLEKWHFPHCLGAVDGKHIRITRPTKSGSYFYNYKGFFSIVLLAIVNANYEFIMVNVGTNGRVSDGGVIENTNFYDKLQNNRLNIPVVSNLHDSNKELPFVFIGDEAFSLRTDFLIPYSLKELTYPRKIFNYRLSRARNVVENAFGILVTRFRIFHTEINIKLANVEKAVLACCSLHNFLRYKCGESYMSTANGNDCENPRQSTNKGTEFAPLQRGYNRNASEEAKEIREMFLKYFNEEGQIPWQQDRVTHQNNEN